MNIVAIVLAALAAGLAIALAALWSCRNKITELSWKLSGVELNCQRMDRLSDGAFNDQRIICEYLGIEIVAAPASRKAQKISRKKEAA